MRRLSLWGPVFGWAALIFVVSSIPHLTTRLGFWDLVLRKAAHIIEFGVLTGLLIRAFRGSNDGSVKRAVGWAWAAAVLYAASDEFHQVFVPGRIGSPMDVLIDAVGITGVCLSWMSRVRKARVGSGPGRPALKAAFLAASFFLPLLGCVGPKIQKTLDGWVGQPEGALFQAWGIPSKTLQVGETTIYEYHSCGPILGFNIPSGGRCHRWSFFVKDGKIISDGFNTY